MDTVCHRGFSRDVFSSQTNNYRLCQKSYPVGVHIGQQMSDDEVQHLPWSILPSINQCSCESDASGLTGVALYEVLYGI
jgi:hypothetical protein